MTQYQMDCLRTWKKDAPEREQLIESCFGLFGEAGEVIDHLKKHLFHSHELDLAYLSNELGDTLYYINVLAAIVGLDTNDVQADNMLKRAARYPNGFEERMSIYRKENLNDTSNAEDSM